MKTFFAFILLVLMSTVNVFAAGTDLPFGEKEDPALTALSNQKTEMVRISVFGEDSIDVPFLKHIPSFTIFVSLQPDRSVVVTERLVLVLPGGQNMPFVRSYPLSYTGPDGKEKFSQLDFLWASYNKKTIEPVVHKTDSEMQLIFFNGEFIERGVHVFEISYIIPNGVSQFGNITNLFMPLLGTSLDYPAERVQIFFNYPEEMTLSNAQLLFGSNNQENDEAYDGYTDEGNHLVFKLKSILPETVDVRLNVSGDAKGFNAVELDEKIDQNLNLFGWIILSVICTFIMILYFYFTAMDVRDNMQNSKYLVKMRSKFFYDVGMMRWLFMHKADERTLYAEIIHFLQKGLIGVRFDEHEQILLTCGEEKKQNFYEKNMLSFILGGKKERKLSTWILSSKAMKQLKNLVLKNIYRQKVLFLQREVLIGALLPLIALIISICLSYSIQQIFGEFIIMLVAYVLCVNHFVRKAKVDILMRQLFEEYTERSLIEAKQREVDAALEKNAEAYSNDTELLIVFKGKRLPLSDFEKMFFEQLRF